MNFQITLGRKASGLFLFVCSFLLNFVTPQNVCHNSPQDIDLNLLGAYSWVVPISSRNNTVDLMYLSLCEGLNFTKTDPLRVCNDAMVCRVVTADGKTTVKSYIPYNSSNTESVKFEKNYMFLSGGECPQQKHREVKVLITFQCDTHLNSPYFLIDVFCQTVLRWRTSAACGESKPSSLAPEPRPRKPVQIPCYVVDESTGVKYDLSHLTKLSGFHRVEAAKMELYINVCQDINDPMITWKSGAAAYLNLQSRFKEVGFIKPDTRVELVKGSKDLVITYSGNPNSKPFQNCSSKPSTVIHFRCPSKKGRANRPPRLMANISCQYVIEWETDHACPEHTVLGDVQECKLNVDGNLIELGRLRNPKGYHRVPNVTIQGAPREVVIDICNLGIGNNGVCGAMGSLHSANVCYKDENGNAFFLGSKSDAHLRYTDGRAILVYPDGSICKNHSNRKWSTVVEFVCDTDSTFGEPSLVQVDSDWCMVQFEWRTVSACVPDVIIPESDDYSDFQETCIHIGNNFTVDLTALRQSTGAWLVLDEAKRFPHVLQLDVCAPLRSTGVTANCAHDSSVCGIGDNDVAVSYGKFHTMKLTQEYGRPVSLLEFSDGDQCAFDSKLKYQTKVHMVCVPGGLRVVPRFIAFDEKNCVLHLEWHTSAACPQVSLTNSTCNVENADYGFKIDLTPLMKLGVQTIQYDKYEYDISVCAPLPTNHRCSENAAICRRNLMDTQAPTSLGPASSYLTYNSGMATVVYQGINESSSIIFVCDFHAQTGRPTVLAALPGQTVIEWVTAFACPTSNAHHQSCLVLPNDKSNQLYDLSRLSRAKRNKNWVVEGRDVSDPTIRLRFHIALCQPLNDPPPGCNPTASVCVETIYPNNSRIVADAGHAVDPPTFERGQLMLNYSNGETCVHRGVKSTMRTVIHFLCDEDAGSSGEFLQFIGKLDGCGYSLLWTTAAACPIRHQVVKDECTVVDTLSGDVFDVSHMRAESYYRADNYQFNLCGPIRNSKECPGGNVSVCLIAPNGKGIPLAMSFGYQLDFVGMDSLRMMYLGEVAGNTTRVEIELVCSKNEKFNESSFEVIGTSGDDRVHRINFFSVGFCPTQRGEPASCEIINRESGQIYDLRPLAKKSLSNWQAEESSPFNEGYTHIRNPNHTYIFNICRRLNVIGNSRSNCPKDSFACITQPESSQQPGISLGRHMDEITFGDDGSIAIRFVGGDPCPPGDDTQGIKKARMRSSLINLVCSPSSEEIPKVLKSSDQCDYLFYMETPSACPVKKSIGSDCRVRDPTYNYEFDLSPLAAFNKSYTVLTPGRKGVHKLSICQSLPDAADFCGGDDKAGSCIIGLEGQNISLGKATSMLQYDTGILTLVYNDGSMGCLPNGEKRSTTIHFLCDHSAVVGSTSPQFESMDENCGFILTWYTELACPPREEVPCSVESSLGFVDLSKLSNPRSNYYTLGSGTEEDFKYVINVCRSVVPKQSLACDFKSGACGIIGNKTINMGIASRPFFNQEELTVQIVYKNGDLCPEGPKGARWSTSITFECNEREETGPLHLLSDNCTSLFVWHTRYACPVSSELKPSSDKICTAVHPLSNQTIDLRSLVRADHESPLRVKGPNGSEYKLNICGKASHTSCGDDVGICLERRGEYAHKVGSPATKLIWDEGVLAMVFTGGERCRDLPSNVDKQMSAIIHFVCPSAGFGTEAPTFVSQSHDDCEHKFVWSTELACNQVLQCVHSDEGESYDLSTLSSRAHPVVNIIDPGYEYFLSVCRPLEPKRPYSSMPPNAAAVRVASNMKRVNSLGHVYFEPFTNFHNGITLLYLNGSQCEYDEKQLNKAQLNFECDYSQDVGEPVLIDIDRSSCIYIFRWRTNLVCPGASDTYTINPKHKCKFEIPQRGITLDLTPLARKSPYQIKATGPDGSDSGHFSMSVCRDHPTSGCKNSELCFIGKDKNVSYGIAESFFFQRNNLYMRFNDGSLCDSTLRKHHSALVMFECDPLYETGGPVIEKQYTCFTLFRWKTAHVCSKQQLREHSSHECVISDGSKTYDLTMLSSVSHVWTLDEPESKSTFYLNVCGMGYNWPIDALDKCSHSGACIKRPVDNGNFKFSSLGDYLSREMEIVGDGHVRITYKGGDPDFCHRQADHPTTVINLQCDIEGDLVGTPKLVQEPTSQSCTFVFNWPTRVACAEATDELVVQTNGFLVDPRLHLAFNLMSLFNSTYRVPEQRNHNDDYTYLINLGEISSGTNREVPWRIGPCAQSAVCQSKRARFMKNVGSVSKQKFLLRGRELLLEIDTGAICLDKANETIKSIFTFTCDNERKTQAEPVFVYETRSCHYIFSWPTEHVCADKFVPKYVIESQVREDASSAAGVVTILVIFCLLVAGGLIFFSRPENRMAVRSRTLRFFRTVTMPHYYYSKTESEMQSPLDNDGDTVLLSPSLVLQPEDEDYTPLA